MEKAVKRPKIGRKEKISNDFLLQFAYNIAALIMLTFLYNGSLQRYGGGVLLAMPAILWVGFGIFAAAAVTYAVLWRLKARNGYKIAAIYLGATALGFFWCIGAQRIAWRLAYNARLFPTFFGVFANRLRQIQILFYAVGVTVAVEIGFYIYRMNKLSNMVKRKKK